MYQRLKKLFPELIKHFDVDLSDLTIYTEAASGSYLATPIIAAFAGAKKVYAQTGDSNYGKMEDIEKNTYKLAKEFGVESKIQVFFERNHNALGQADIVTNSGFVRPFDVDLIDALKPTAVIPLMWETWEYNKNYFNLEYCKKKKILVLGTVEHKSPCDIRPYSFFFGLKLLFNLDLEGHKTKVLLLGGNMLSVRMAKDFLKMGIETTVFSNSGFGYSYDSLLDNFSKEGDMYDVILVFEHQFPLLLLGKNGLLEYNQILKINPSIKIGHIAGHIDIEGLRKSGLDYYPDNIRSFGLMSYQACELGPQPVLELYTAGLKVGEAMSRARLAGKLVIESAAYALKNSPADDFPGESAWIE